MTEPQIGAQKAFDRAWNGMKAQGFRQSADRLNSLVTPRCLYAGPDGMRCVAGHACGDFAHLLKEGDGILYQEVSSRFTDDALAVLLVLQASHDDFASSAPEKMELRLRHVASEYNLSVPE